MVKQDLDKVWSVGFIALVKEVSWLSLIVIVLKNNKKLWICVDFQQLNATTNPHKFTQICCEWIWILLSSSIELLKIHTNLLRI